MRLRRMGEEVQSRGIFGAPTFFAEDGEMFWGNDRLEQALDWALAQAQALGLAGLRHRSPQTGGRPLSKPL